MSGGYALVDDFNPTFYTLGDIAKVTEECFLNCYGTNHMYLPPQNYKAWADDEDEEHPHLAQPTVGQPTVGGPGYKAHKAWADYEDEEAPRIPWDPVDDLKLKYSQDWTEVVHMWVPDLGLALRVCPGMAFSSGADCSAPGISPCPLRGSRPT